VRQHLNRVSHFVVNVSKLERSLEFYESVTPLRVVGVADAPPQAFSALGIDHGSFRSVLLADGSSGQPGVVVQLVQWLDPTPSGSAYPTFFHRGLYRFCFLTSDLDDRYATALAAGRAPIRPPKGHGIPVPGGSEGRTFVLRDPDGIPVQFTRRPSSWRDDLPDQLYHVNIVSGDLDGTRHFLQHVLGLDYIKRLTLPEPVGPIGFGDGSDVGQFDAVFFRHRGDHRFAIDVVDWFVPGVTGEPYRDAAHIGIQRIGFEVDDLDAAVSELTASEVDVAGPDVWDLGDAGQRRVAIVRDAEGIVYEIVQQPPFDGARDTRWPPEAFSDHERSLGAPDPAGTDQ
jgi:catechol 2,3-dioxygenase-like lactoylglutathione lyase family enzyme